MAVCGAVADTGEGARPAAAGQCGLGSNEPGEDCGRHLQIPASTIMPAANKPLDPKLKLCFKLQVDRVLILFVVG